MNKMDTETFLTFLRSAGDILDKSLKCKTTAVFSITNSIPNDNFSIIIPYVKDKDKDNTYSYKGICSDKYSGEYDSQFDFSSTEFTMNVIEKGTSNFETKKGPLKIQSKSKFQQNNNDIN
jgi:hypothetical protein